MREMIIWTGDMVNVRIKPNDLFTNDFSGTVVGRKGKNMKIIQVRDQDDNVWDCDEDQVELAVEN